MNDSPINETQPSRQTCSAGQKIGMAGFRIFEGILSILPMGLLCRIGRAAGGIAYFILPSRRRITGRNLRIVIDTSLKGRKLKELTLENFKRMGMNMLASVKTATMSDEALMKHVTLNGRDGFEKKQLQGESTICAVSHSGNWEILARIRVFFPNVKNYGSMYRKMDNPLMEEYLYSRRTEAGTSMFCKEDGAQPPLHFLKKEAAALGILCDQFVQEGVYVPFFGKVTGTTYLPALFHKRTKAAINTVGVRSEKVGHWICDMSNFVDLSTADSSFAGMTTAVNQSIEQLLSLSPLDSFWMHHRWKITANFAPRDEKANRLMKTMVLKPMRIMVATPLSFEEALLAVPLVKALRAARCDIQVNIICPPEQEGFWRTIEEASHVISGTSKKEIISKLSSPSIYDEGPYDLGIMLDERKETIQALQAFAPVSFSGFTSHPMIGKVRFVAKVPAFRASPLYHRMEDYLRILKAHDILRDNPEFFPAPRSEASENESFVIAPFSSLGSSNEWHEDNWIELAGSLPRPVRMVALPQDRERAQRLAEKMNMECICLPAEELLPALKSAYRVIASDGLIPALASHAGTPCIVLFGSRLPVRNRPLGSQHRCLHVHKTCAGCLRTECDNKVKCIDEIKPSDVLAALS